MTRLNEVSMILGRRRAGKTTYTKAIIAAIEKSQPDKKILIIDTFDNPDYAHVPIINCDMIERWKGSGTYRIFGSNTDEILFNVEQYLRNAFIIHEDASKYIRRSLSEDLRRYIIDSKQKNLDLLFIFHGFSFAPPEMFRLVDSIVLFKCDNPAHRKTEIVNYENIKKAYDYIMKDPCTWAHITLNIY